jgi:glutaconate CoA-transferase subunit A
MTQILHDSVDSLAALIPDGSKVAVPTDYSGIAMEFTRAMIRNGVRDLHLVCVPTTGLQGDMLIGAGAVKTLETSAVSLGEFGGGPRFQNALKSGGIEMRDATCPAIHAGIQAGQKGIPFMPLRGMIGSDLMAARPDWQVQQNPFSDEEDPIVLLPAIVPDFAVFHAPKADRFGNVYIGVRRELVAMACAAKMSLVTVEEVVEGNLLEDQAMASGTLSSVYVQGVAEAKQGAWPLSFMDDYAADETHMKAYVAAARSDEGFAAYLQEFVQGADRAAAAE